MAARDPLVSKFARQSLIVPLLGALAAGCSPPSVRVSGTPTAAVASVDFSGSWEIDYQLSDRVEDNANFLYLEALAEARRATDGRIEPRPLRLPAWELVQLADSISRTQVLEITQDAASIEVDRGEEFALTCTFGPEGPYVAHDPLGSEVCGWDGHQLVFAFQMPDQLWVVHRLTVATEEDKLNVATTVRRRGTNQAFTLNRVYRRFEPLPDEYECRTTVAGTKSCRPIGPESAPRARP